MEERGKHCCEGYCMKADYTLVIADEDYTLVTTVVQVAEANQGSYGDTV